MWTRYFSRMHSGTYNDALFLNPELFGFSSFAKDILVLKTFILLAYVFHWRYDNKIYRSSFQGFNNICPFKVNICLFLAFFLYLCEKAMVFCVGPRVEKSKKDFFASSNCMLEAPLYPTLVMFLNHSYYTIFVKSILCTIFFQSLLLSSR